VLQQSHLPPDDMLEEDIADIVIAFLPGRLSMGGCSSSAN
jgi:hypothetical protein